MLTLMISAVGCIREVLAAIVITRMLMPYHRTATNAILAALFYTIMSVSCISARAQGRLEAQYGITMTGVPIGRLAWHVDIGNNFYATSANGKASGVLNLLMDGDG